MCEFTGQDIIKIISLMKDLSRDMAEKVVACMNETGLGEDFCIAIIKDLDAWGINLFVDKYYNRPDSFYYCSKYLAVVDAKITFEKGNINYWIWHLCGPKGKFVLGTWKTIR